jgi:hypothetical protein
MARQRREKNVKLKQPDRSAPDPSHETLLDLAEKRGLLKPQPAGVNAAEADEQDEEESLVGRLGESMLWSISLTALHFTLDVLVSHQYAVDIEWPHLFSRAGQALPSTLHNLRNVVSADEF